MFRYDIQLSNSQCIIATYAIIYFSGITTEKTKTWGEFICARVIVIEGLDKKNI